MNFMTLQVCLISALSIKASGINQSAAGWRRSRVVMFMAIRLRGPGFKPRPEQKFENENFCFRRLPIKSKHCSPKNYQITIYSCIMGNFSLFLETDHFPAYFLCKIIYFSYKIGYNNILAPLRLPSLKSGVANPNPPRIDTPGRGL